MKYYKEEKIILDAYKKGNLRLLTPSIHDGVIICASDTAPFDKLRVTGHGEPVEPCVGCFLSAMIIMRNYL